MGFSRFAIATVALASLLQACGSSDKTGGPVGGTTLTVVAGGGQSAVVGSKVNVTVEATNGSGPVPDQTVAFQVTAGGGSIYPRTVTTDASGRASAVWTLGGALGNQTATATIDQVAPAQITANAMIGPPTFVQGVDQNLVAVVGSSLSKPVSVKVTDAFSNPIAGVALTAAVVQGGGTISTTAATTDRNGVASFGTWTLGPKAGANVLRASVSATVFGNIQATGTASAIVAIQGNGITANAGTLVPVRPAVRALGPNGQPLADVQVEFDLVSGGGQLTGQFQTTGADGIATLGGWLLGPNTGPNQITARAPGLDPVTFTVQGVEAIPATIQPIAGTTSTGMLGNFLGQLPSVVVTDPNGLPAAGLTVNFVVASGDGSVYGASPRTDANGKATLASWRLGPSATTQTVTATVGALAPVTFTATASPVPAGQFKIEVRYMDGTNPTPAQRAAFDAAVARWQGILLSDLSDELVREPASDYGCYPAMDETVDDLVIYAELTDIDGAGGVLGSAGPCLLRDQGLLTVVGHMRFDTADLADLESMGQLNNVILHEMGHVLGFGTIWEPDYLNVMVGRGGSNPYFTGPFARSAFAGAFLPGTSYPGLGVPIENTGGPGTRDGHWREATVSNELMTGWLNDDVNPLSAFTIEAFRDMGYVVNDTQADPFTFAASLMAAAGARPAYMLNEAPLAGPMYRVRGGRIVGKVERK